MSLSSIILAGGQSSRMGKDKALLSLAGQPLLRHICLTAQAYAEKVYIVSPWPAKYADILPQECELIEEINWQLQSTNGPLIAFAQGLTRITSEWVLLLACDLPGVEKQAIAPWIPLLTEVAPSTMAILPRTERGWEPLLGFYRRSCLASLQICIARGIRSFQGWLPNLEVAELPVKNPRVLFNCNTPADWERFLQL